MGYGSIGIKKIYPRTFHLNLIYILNQKK